MYVYNIICTCLYNYTWGERVKSKWESGEALMTQGEVGEGGGERKGRGDWSLIGWGYCRARSRCCGASKSRYLWRTSSNEQRQTPAADETRSYPTIKGVKKDDKLFQLSFYILQRKGLGVWFVGVVSLPTYPIAPWLSASIVEDEKSEHVRHGTDNKGNETVSVDHWENKRKNHFSLPLPLSFSLSLSPTHTHTHTL